jgi:hypothetical protein
VGEMCSEPQEIGDTTYREPSMRVHHCQHSEGVLKAGWHFRLGELRPAPSAGEKLADGMRESGTRAAASLRQ